MSKKWMLLLAALALLAMPATAQREASSVRRAIQASWDEWSQVVHEVVATKDYSKLAPAVERLQTPDCVSTFPDGTNTTGDKATVDLFKTFLGEMTKLYGYKGRIRTLSRRADGSAIVVFDYVITYDTIDSHTAKTQRVVLRGSERDTFIKTTQWWKMKRSRNLGERAYRDGVLDTPERIARREIQRDCDHWGTSLNDVVKTQDFRRLATAVDRHWTADCFNLWADGTTFRGRAQAVASFTPFLAQMHKLYRYDLQVTNVTLRGARTAQAVVRFDISYDNVDAKTGKTHRITDRGSERDTFVKTAQGWQTKRSQSIAERFFTDGVLDTPATIARREIQAINDLYLPACRQAIQSQDFAGFRAYLERYSTPDYVSVDPSGKTTPRGKSLADWVALVRSMKSFDRCDLKIEKVRLVGKNAAEVVLATDQAWIVSDAHGEEHPVTFRSREKDLWVRTPDGWKAKRSQDLERKVTTDGKE